ncbi:tight adherence pilus pseudopilin TadF [Vibrio maritimus]|uniref:tight adherence pilus pseudopilin TadF n=1 Tax=Vibrio maritimus TaxID=990268 RepID=UPI001F39617E|nr:tight adherence pilus pseudopilin TadF [Vibrio maritimus]
MNKMKKQKGVFAIELGFILFALCAIFLFATDISHKLLVRAKLDRTSFALVNILKERYRYFDGSVVNKLNLDVTETELLEMRKVAARLLNTTEDEVAIKIESLVDAQFTTTFTSAKFDSLGCSVGSISSEAGLAPTESGTIYPLYRVSVCEEHDSWFDPFVGGSTEDIAVTSSSVMPGR